MRAKAEIVPLQLPVKSRGAIYHAHPDPPAASNRPSAHITHIGDVRNEYPARKTLLRLRPELPDLCSAHRTATGRNGSTHGEAQADASIPQHFVYLTVPHFRSIQHSSRHAIQLFSCHALLRDSHIVSALDPNLVIVLHPYPSRCRRQVGQHLPAAHKTSLARGV